MDRARRRILTRWLFAVIAVIAVIGLGGCGGGDDDSTTEPTLTSIDSATTANTTGPPPDTGGGGPSVDLASAPVGGQSEQSDVDPAIECLAVNWLAGDDADIPDGATVSLGGFSFDPAVLDIVGSGCETRGPHCDGFEFTSSEQACSLPVRWNGTAYDPDIGQASANVPATASCDEESDACTAFLEAVGQQSPAQLSVTLPAVDVTTTEPTEPTELTETSTAGETSG